MTEPRTEASRTLLDLLYNEDEEATFTARQVIEAVRAIERESYEEGMLRQLERHLAEEQNPGRIVNVGPAAPHDPPHDARDCPECDHWLAVSAPSLNRDALARALVAIAMPAYETDLEPMVDDYDYTDRVIELYKGFLAAPPSRG